MQILPLLMLLPPLPPLLPLHIAAPLPAALPSHQMAALGSLHAVGGERAVSEGQHYTTHLPTHHWGGPGPEILSTYLHREASFFFSLHSMLRSCHFVKLRNPRVLASLCDWLSAWGFFKHSHLLRSPSDWLPVSSGTGSAQL